MILKIYWKKRQEESNHFVVLCYSSTKEKKKEKKKNFSNLQITEMKIVYRLYRMIKKIIIFKINSTHWKKIKKYYSKKHVKFNIFKIINLYKWTITLL